LFYFIINEVGPIPTGAAHKKAASFPALGYRGSGHGQQKNLRAEVFRLPFSQSLL